MQEECLIDGYNLLNAPQRSQARTPAKQARESFLSDLSGYASLKKTLHCVVLDGRGEQGELDVYQTPYFRVVYSQKISADAWIERALFERRTETRFTVVTDDRAIANIARGSGAMVLDCRRFRELMAEALGERRGTEQRDQMRSHGFNRPFRDKLKDL